MVQSKTTKPQHLVTVLDPPKKGEWPDAWKKDPELLALVAQHQSWLVHPITQKLRHILQQEILRLSGNVGSQAVTPDTTSETVRVTAAQLNKTTQLEKTIYDTEKFIQAVTSSKQ